MALHLPRVRTRKTYTHQMEDAPPAKRVCGPLDRLRTARLESYSIDIPPDMLFRDFNACSVCLAVDALVEDAVTAELTCHKCGVVNVPAFDNPHAEYRDDVTIVRKGVYKHARYFLRVLEELQGNADVEQADVDAVRARLRQYRVAAADVTPSLVRLALKDIRRPGLYRYRWAITRQLNPATPLLRLTAAQKMAACILFSRFLRVFADMRTGRLSCLSYLFVAKKLVDIVADGRGSTTIPDLATDAKHLTHERWWGMAVPRIVFTGIAELLDGSASVAVTAAEHAREL